MFPQVAPKFFANRHEGPKNVGKDPAARVAPPAAPAPGAETDPGYGPVRSAITYAVTLDGRAHKVTVTPA